MIKVIPVLLPYKSKIGHANSAANKQLMSYRGRKEKERKKEGEGEWEGKF